MATATRARRTRAEAPTYNNVQLKSGRGTVHAANKTATGAYPACRAATTLTQNSRYGNTTKPVDCAKCLESADALPATPREPRQVSQETPRASRARRNGKAQQEADAQATEIIAAETAKVVAKRDEPTDQRKPGCSDEDYALAVRVREYRSQGAAWWKIGHELGLKGSGASVKTGKTGAAHARRLWEKAWGATYKDTSVPRETRALKAERAVTQPGRPYFEHDTMDLDVIAAVKGKEIEWVARVGNDPATAVCSVLKAEVNAEARVDVVMGPLGRVLRFYEIIRDEKGIPMVGPHRSVYIDRIERVGL